MQGGRRELMLYSSCKSPLLEIRQLQMVIIRKIEIGNGDGLTVEFLCEEVHPSSRHISKVLQNQKVLQEKEEFEV